MQIKSYMGIPDVGLWKLLLRFCNWHLVVTSVFQICLDIGLVILRFLPLMAYYYVCDETLGYVPL